jgi:hypothetical protein
MFTEDYLFTEFTIQYCVASVSATSEVRAPDDYAELRGALLSLVSLSLTAQSRNPPFLTTPCVGAAFPSPCLGIMIE